MSRKVLRMALPLHEQIQTLRAESARMAGQVQQLVADAVDAAVRGDVQLARRVIEADEQIDTTEVQVEKKAIDLLLLFQPAAGEFRLVLMVIKVNNDLERIADCAANVAERVGILHAESDSGGEAYRIPDDLRRLGEQVAELTRLTVQAYNFADVDLATQVLAGDDRIDALYAQIVQDALSDMRRESGHVNRDLAQIMMAKNLERIGDHCTNIAEDIVYIRSGQIIRHRQAV